MKIVSDWTSEEGITEEEKFYFYRKAGQIGYEVLNQVKDMIKKLLPRKNPLIMMGDFNCEWTKKGSALYTLAQKLDLKGYQPNIKNMHTFPLLKKRFEYIPHKRG